MKHLLVLACFAGPVEPPALPTQSDATEKTQQRDPTIPGPEIQRRTKPAPAPAPKRPEVRRTPVTRAPAPVIIPPPQMTLKSLVVSSDDRCTATLNAGGQTVTVAFARGETQRKVQLPEVQFADLAATIQQLSRDLAQLRQKMAEPETPATLNEKSNGDTAEDFSVTPLKTESAEEDLADAADQADSELLNAERALLRKMMKTQPIDLASSFTIDGSLYRIIDFTRDTLLVEQIPLGKYFIVR